MPENSSPRALLEESAASLLALLDALPESALDRPTPCSEWDVRDLVLHVADAADELTTRATGSPGRERLATSPSALARERILQLLAVAAEDPDAAHEAVLGGAIELSAHAWDLDVALGGAGLRSEHAEAVLALARQLVDGAARAAFFGPVVEVGADRPASDRLAGFLGRDPSWAVSRVDPS